jgi:phosphoserine phosphatase
VAREIQQSLMPDAAPQVAGYDIAGWNRPADETGGDCYDFVQLEDGRWGLMLADATGHGIGPALMVSECRALLRAAIVTPDDLAGGMQRANVLLGRDVPPGRFVTVFYGVLDPGQHRVGYISAGHGPLLHLKGAANRRVVLSASTLPMGIMPELDAEVPPPMELDPGDVLLLVTDGFFEWLNPQGEQFGTERIFELAASHSESSSAELIRRLHEAVLGFADGVPQVDDLTAIVVRRLK